MTKEINQAKIIDRAQGMFAGLALGDALGAPFERKEGQKRELYNGKLEFGFRIKTKWRGYYNAAVGQATDDTEMSLTLAHALFENKGVFNIDKTILTYLNWCNSGSMMMGKNTRLLMMGVKTLSGYKNRMQTKVLDKEKDLLKQSESNGALMRCSPLALIEDQVARESAVIADCSITNRNPNCIAVNICYVNLLHKVVFDKKIVDSDFVVELVNSETNILHSYSYLDMKKLAEEKGTEGRNVDIEKTKGWCQHSFYCALVALFHLKSDRYDENIDKIVKMWGDCDTNAAIAGAILGAKIGLKVMKKEKKTAANLEIMLNSNADRSSKLTAFSIGDKQHSSSITAEFVTKMLEFCRQTTPIPKSFVFTPLFKSMIIIKKDYITSLSFEQLFGITQEPKITVSTIEKTTSTLPLSIPISSTLTTSTLKRNRNNDVDNDVADNDVADNDEENATNDEDDTIDDEHETSKNNKKMKKE